MACIFCDNSGPLSREHVFATWLKQAVDTKGRIVHTYAPHAGHPGKALEWEAAGFDVVTRKVCTTCNTGWMAELEEQTRPILTPLIRGKVRHLDVADQTIIARWAGKTAVTLNAADHATPSRFPNGFVTALKSGEPPPMTQVWFGALDFRAVAGANVRMRISGPGFQAQLAVMPLLLLGRLLLVAFVRLDPRALPRLVQHTLQNVLSQIWPPVERVRWPPPAALSESQMAAFPQMFEASTRSLDAPFRLD